MNTKDHIHLSTTIGSAPEYSPDIKWKVRVDGWVYEPYIISDHRRTLTGQLKVHTLKTSGGDPVQFLNNRYVLKIDDYWDMTGKERLDAIVAMQGKSVKLIDSLHDVDDGQNHSSYVKNMHLSLVADIAQINPQLTPLYLTVELIDDNTVT